MKMFSNLTLVVALLCLAACTPTKSLETNPSTVSQTPLSGFPQQIVFTSYRDGNAEIYKVILDGTIPTNLTNNPASDSSPSPSPDGKKIAFISNRDDNDLEIYVMNADGSQQTRLTNTPGEDAYPHWSPDSQRIVFSSMQDGNFHIWVMNADGRNLTRLTQDNDPHLYPVWLLGGDIAFTRIQVDGNVIYRMNSDGSNQRLIEFLPSNVQAVWSPDETKIAFSAKENEDFANICNQH